MKRILRYFGLVALVVVSVTAGVLGPKLYEHYTAVQASKRWAELTPAEREESNRKASEKREHDKDLTAYRAKLIANGGDPENDIAANRDDPEKQKLIASRKAAELAAAMNAQEAARLNSPENVAKRKAEEDERKRVLAMIDNPDGNLVRMTPAEDAAAVAKITRALGRSPFQENLMRARHPWFIRFTHLGMAGGKVVMGLSHPKSHFAIVNSLNQIDKVLAPPCRAIWVKGPDNKIKVAILFGYAERKVDTYIAVTMKDGKELSRKPLEKIPGTKFDYVMDDNDFSFIAIYADQVSEDRMIYALEVSPELAQRSKFFAAY